MKMTIIDIVKNYFIVLFFTTVALLASLLFAPIIGFLFKLSWRLGVWGFNLIA